MTIAAMLRVILFEAIMMGILLVGFSAFIDELEDEGFHWFKTPFVACWMMIGALATFYSALMAVSKNSKDS